jgi:hypothetical protein
MPCIKCHRFPRSQLRWCLPGTEKTPGACRELGRVLSRGMRQTGLTGGKILPAHGFRDEGNCWCGLLLCLVLFRLVVLPLQSGVVESYLIRDAWFPSHLPLEGTSHIQIFEL